MTQNRHIVDHAADAGDAAADQAFLGWGDGAIAYVKEVTIDGDEGFAIHAADGRPLGVVRADRDLAFAVVRQNDLEPVSVH